MALTKKESKKIGIKMKKMVSSIGKSAILLEKLELSIEALSVNLINLAIELAEQTQDTEPIKIKKKKK